jgi:hypothetical protein
VDCPSGDKFTYATFLAAEDLSGDKGKQHFPGNNGKFFTVVVSL